MNRRYITYDQAVSILPDGEYVHTFINGGFGLMGADWSREEILDKLQKSEVIELTGEKARSMGHGMCAYNKNAKWQSDLLFIETNEERLAQLENKEPPKGMNDETYKCRRT